MKKCIIVSVALLYIFLSANLLFAATFSQADLTGTWHINVLRTGAENMWMRATFTIDSSGVATCVSMSDSGGTTTCPDPFDLTFTMNETTGVITQSGGNAANAGTSHATMALNKKFAAGTSTTGDNPNYSYQLNVMQKVIPGTTYSAADMQNKTFVIHELLVGASNTWQHSVGSSDAVGTVTLSSLTNPSGTTTPGVVGVGSIASDGTVSMSGAPFWTSYQGFMSDDKKTIVGTFTDAYSNHYLQIGQITGQTYTAGPMPAGTFADHTLACGATSFWLHYTDAVGSSGVPHLSDWVSSNPGAIAPTVPMIIYIDATGTITVDGIPSFHGQMSDDGTFAVGTQTHASGIYSLLVTTKVADASGAYNVGTPFLIGTSTYGNMSASAAFDGTNYLVGMEEGVDPDDSNDTQTAQFISQSGALIGSRIYIGHRGGMPRVGFNGTNYLVYWPDDGDLSETGKAIYGQVISPSGTTVKDAFAISPLSTITEPGAFFCKSTEECTVTWSLRSGNGTVYGRDISPDGSFLTDEYTLFSNTRTDTASVDTGAACDSSGNCLIAIDIGSQILALIKGPTINKSSFVIATKAPTGSCTDKNPVSIAFDGTNYLVVWNDHSDCAAVPAWDVLAQRIDASGNLVGSAFQVNSASTWRAAFPSIAFDGNNYLVAWTDGRNDADGDGVCDSGEGTCDDIYGQLVTKSGTLSDSEFIINNDAGNQLGLITGFNAGKYLVLVNTGTSRVGNGALSSGSVYGVFINTNSSLYGHFAGAGIWKWDGSAWSQVTPSNPEAMVASGSNLYGDFGSSGIWQWDGSTWSQVTPNDPQIMSVSGSNLYGAFTGGGIWKWDGSSWSQVTPSNPEAIVASGSNLYGDFGMFGIWQWDGSAWSQVTPSNPEGMVALGSNLYGDFGSAGIWQWDGSSWSQVTPSNPEAMVASGSVLYGDFGSSGIWKWDGSIWSQVTPSNPEAMVASGSNLYGDFGSAGIWQWGGSTWSQVTPNDPVNMVTTTKSTWYRDQDGDGYGVLGETFQSYTQPVGYAAVSGDCNDLDDSIHPGATEVCYDGIDNDCDGQTDEGCVGSCSPGATRLCPLQHGVCLGIEQTCGPSNEWIDCNYGPSYPNEVCDGKDNDCDGQTDEDCKANGEPCTSNNECINGSCIDYICQ